MNCFTSKLSLKLLMNLCDELVFQYSYRTGLRTFVARYFRNYLELSDFDVQIKIKLNLSF